MSSPPAKVGKLPPFGGELQRQLHFGGPVKVGFVERAIKPFFKFSKMKKLALGDERVCIFDPVPFLDRICRCVFIVIPYVFF